jgi:hypothetical protein
MAAQEKVLKSLKHVCYTKINKLMRYGDHGLTLVSYVPVAKGLSLVH